MKNNRKSRFKVALALTVIVLLSSCIPMPVSRQVSYEIPTPMHGTWVKNGKEYRVSSKYVEYKPGDWDSWHTIIGNNVVEVINNDNYDYYDRTYYTRDDSVELSMSKNPADQDYMWIGITMYRRK